MRTYFTKFTYSFLIGYLDQAEGRLETVDKNELDASFIYGRIYLIEKL